MKPSSDANTKTGMQAVWDDRYRRHGRIAKYDHWLDRWRDHLPSQGLILNLGCGDGVDTCVLCEWGFQSLSVDWSTEALHLTRQVASQSPVLRVDFSGGLLPFRPETFSAMIASLSLHYFDTKVTQQIIDDIYRCLIPNSPLIVRFNSTKDVNHGAEGHPEIEPCVFLIDGQQKRFFTEPSTRSLFQNGWYIHNIEELTIDRYTHSKVVWEVMAIRK